MQSLKELSDLSGKLTADLRKIVNLADENQNGSLTAEQELQADEIEKELEKTQQSIKSIQKQNIRRDNLSKYEATLNEPIGRQTQPSSLSGAIGGKTNDVSELSISCGSAGVKKLRLQPGSQLHSRAQESYQLGFENFIQTGNASGLMSAEQLGMKAGDNPRGGYLAPMTFVSNLIKFLDNQVFMRQLSTVYPNISPTGMGAVAWETDPGDADWTAEVLTTDMSEDDTARVGKRELIPKDLSKLVLASRKLINGNTMLSVEDLIIQRLGYKFAVTEEKAFLTGTGGNTPLGVFTASPLGISTGRDAVGGAATTFDADDVIGVFYNLKAAYQAKATWLVSREWVKRARKLKASTSGEYIWAPALGTEPALIMGRPFVVSEYVPTTYTAGLYIALCGDFSYYWIADCYDITVDRLDELFRLKKQIGFIGEKSTDGAPVLEEAFSRMRLA